MSRTGSRSRSGSPDPHRGRPGAASERRAIDVEGTAFLTLDGGKITEVWTVFDGLALAVQTGAAKAPAWWPGRS